jgi:hypothetical protein
MARNLQNAAARKEFYMPSRYANVIPVGEAQAYLDSKKEATPLHSVTLYELCNYTTGEYFYVTGGFFMYWDFVNARGFTNTSTTIPHRVVPRPGIEDGLVDTVAKNDIVYHRNMKEIDPFERWPELIQH